MDYNKYEDVIMKMVHEYFGAAVLPFLGIHEPISGYGPTEISALSVTKLYMDFTFQTVSGGYLHLEFQTTDGKAQDLRRFHAYEALLHYQTGKDVTTYVIFTGGITNAVCEDQCGINTYRILPVYMSSRDADAILAELKQKTADGTPLCDEDLVKLALIPVMHSQYSHKERIMKAVNILKTGTGEKVNQVTAVLYAFAEKFVTDPIELQQLKEVMLMTRLGQMLFDDGLEQGREQGLQQGLQQGLEEGLESGLAQGREELQRINRLNAMLLDEGRVGDLKRAFTDSDYQQQLLKEYHL